MSQKSGSAHSTGPHPFTEKQGQYLAFIWTYGLLNARSPAEARWTPGLTTTT